MNEIKKKDKLKLVQIEIAQEIKRICDKNNIKYFLDCGSLLGAIRHKGFIPWDDDMDIGMLKDDYDKFIRIAPLELKKDFFLDNRLVDNNCNIIFSKIRKKNTIFLEKLNPKNSMHNEIFVDIFPYIYVPENKFKRKVLGIRLKLLSHMYMVRSGFNFWKEKGIKSYIKFIPIRIMSIFFSSESIYNKINKIIDKQKESKFVAIHDGMSYDNWYYKKEYLNNFIEKKFEKCFFNVPKDYDEILKIEYGEDYMKLPPLEKRYNHEIIKLKV